MTTLTVAGGDDVLDTATGEVAFTPVLGFSGVATAVHYRVTDAYGQSATATFTPTVAAPRRRAAERWRRRAPGSMPSRAPVAAR